MTLSHIDYEIYFVKIYWISLFDPHCGDAWHRFTQLNLSIISLIVSVLMDLPIIFLIVVYMLLCAAARTANIYFFMPLSCGVVTTMCGAEYCNFVQTKIKVKSLCGITLRHLFMACFVMVVSCGLIMGYNGYSMLFYACGVFVIIETSSMPLSLMLMTSDTEPCQCKPIAQLSHK